MKKLTIVAAIAVAAAAFTSCGNSTPKADLNNDVDSMSYAIGMESTQGLKDHLAMRMGVDTTYMDDFIKGVLEGANAGDDKKKAAYQAGLQIGTQISTQIIKGINYRAFGEDSTQTVSLQNFMAGFIGGVTGKGAVMNMQEAGLVAKAKMEILESKKLLREFGDNKKAGEDFLAENAKNDSVVVLPSGVQYKILKAGKGKVPTDSSTVKIHYEGRLIDGTVFDSSYKRKNPMTSPANGFVKGFNEAIQMMPVGSTWEVYIPQELAYGQQQRSAHLLPFSALIFKIELLSIEK